VDPTAPQYRNRNRQCIQRAAWLRQWAEPPRVCMHVLLVVPCAGAQARSADAMGRQRLEQAQAASIFGAAREKRRRPWRDAPSAEKSLSGPPHAVRRTWWLLPCLLRAAVLAALWS
jgi:hypothetical protein